MRGVTVGPANPEGATALAGVDNRFGDTAAGGYRVGELDNSGTGAWRVAGPSPSTRRVLFAPRGPAPQHTRHEHDADRGAERRAA